MEEKLKLTSIVVVLFFKNLVDYNSLELANKIVAKLPQLGQPNIFNLPNDIPNEIRVQAPKLMFGNSKDINLNLTIAKAQMSISSIENTGAMKELISMLYTAISEENIQVQSMGIVYNYINFDCDFEKIKNIFYKDELLFSDLVNSSWYKKENSLNIWKMLNVQEKNSQKELNIKVDINNNGNSKAMQLNDIESLVDSSLEKIKQFKNELIKKIGE